MKVFFTLVSLFIAGAITTFAYPPFGYIPVMFLTFGFLLWFLQKSKTKTRAFFAGFGFYISYIYTGLLWLLNNLASHLANDRMVFLLLVILIPMGIASLYGFVTLLTFVMPVRHNISKLIVFAVLWTLLSWFIGRLFPETVANVWGGNLEILQLIAYGGIYTLTFLSIMLFASPALLVLNRQDRLSQFTVVFFILLFMGFYWVGFYRLQNAKQAFVPNLKIRMINPAYNDVVKLNDIENKLNHLIMLSKKNISADVRLVVWPEGNYLPGWIPETLPDSINRKYLSKVGAAAPKQGAVVVNLDEIFLKPGVPRDKKRYSKQDVLVLHNTALVLNQASQELSNYDQMMLFPFAEYNPLKKFIKMPKLLDFLHKGAANAASVEYEQGTERKNIRIFDIPEFLTLICYEAILPGKIIINARERPQWLLVLSSDTWFLGLRNTGLYRHYQFVRERAIEEGLAIAKATNNGISVVFDGYGRVVRELPLGKGEYIDTPVPQALSTLPFYTVYRDQVLWVLMSIFLAVALILELFSFEKWNKNKKC